MPQQLNIYRDLSFKEPASGSEKVRFDTDAAANILYILPATDASDYVAFGNGTLNMDVQFFGTHSDYNMLWDESAYTLILTGSGFTMGSVSNVPKDFTLWGTNGAATTYRVLFDTNGDTNGAWYFGGDDYGIDVGFYGQTASNSMVWDASANALIFTAGGITMGTGSKFVLPVKASGSATNGDIWVDTTDYTLHFYANTEYTVTAT